jgi:hypothetical protein
MLLLPTKPYRDWSSMNTTLMSYRAQFRDIPASAPGREVELLYLEDVENDRVMFSSWDRSGFGMPSKMYSLIKGQNISWSAARGTIRLPTAFSSRILQSSLNAVHSWTEIDNGTVSVMIPYPTTVVTCAWPQYERLGPSDDLYYV